MRILVAALGIVVLGLAAFAALAWRPAIAAVDPASVGAFDAAEIEQGRLLAAAGYCSTCHTAAGGAAYAGGRAIESDFGIIYTTNITSDPEQGIGAWSEAAFDRALRKGVRRDGAHLFPALPYSHFAKLSDADVHALYAYFMSVPAATAVIPENTIPAPLNWRALQGGWKLLFVRSGPFKPDAAKSDEWNRGAYLAEGLGHCSACHSPRNSLGAELGGEAAYSGAVIEGWYAPAINAMPDAKLPWTAEELYVFLRTGASPLHGAATGTMSEVVHDGLGELPDTDIRAIATYFADVYGAPAEVTTDEVIAGAAPADVALDESLRRGQLAYVNYCVSCHFNRPDAPSAARPELAANSALTAPDPTNFFRVVLKGVGEEEGNPAASMPGFRQVLSDQDLAALAGYLRATYAPGASGDWSGLEAHAAAARALNDPME